jgi:periplasmic protein CpxP/Spy
MIVSAVQLLSTMKQFLLLLMLSTGLHPFLRAQSTDSTAARDPGYQNTASPKKSSAQRAAHQLNVLQQTLNLNQNQVVRLRMILLNEDIALDSLRTNRSGDRKSNAYSRRTIVQDADQKIDALLTADQKPLYLQWKQEQRQKALERRKNSTSGGTPQQ